MFGLALALMLSACAGPIGGDVRAPVPPGPSCCATLASLPYQTLGPPRRQQLVLAEDAPLFDFPEGRSRFAAFRLPTARPLVVDLTSLQVAGPGLWGQVVEMTFRMKPRQVWAFNPAVLLLDAQFKPVRTVRLDVDTALRCGLGDFSLTMHFNIEDTPAEVAYAVLRQGEGVSERYQGPGCARQLVTHSALARIELLVDTPEFGDGRIVLEAGARWYPDERKIGALSGFYASLMDEADAPGRLLLGAQRLHYYDSTSDGLRRRLDIPIDRIASVRSEHPALAIAAADATGSAVRWHTFRIDHGGLGAALKDLTKPDAMVERIAWEVADWPVAIDFRTAGDKAAAGRIGEAANLGGIVTAMPCGLCASGACGPELLAPCAAAYAVGAALGGVWAMGKELLGALHTAPAQSARQVQREAAAPVQATLQGSFDRGALAGCIAQATAQQPELAWRDQGWTAALPGAPLPRAATAPQRTLTVSVSGIALVTDAPPAAATPAGERPARLVIDAVARLTAAPGGAEASQPLSWQGEARTLAEWGAADAQALPEMLAQACQSLATQALQAGEAMWRRH